MCIIRWISSYLDWKKLATRVERVNNENVDQPNGIPQGSHLAPLIYIISTYDVVVVQ